MDEIERSLATAWRRLAPILARNPQELRKRLVRRDQRLIQSPPRAWCLAIRATDTRLDALATAHPRQDQPHQILLDSTDLKKLCAPIHLPGRGFTLRDLQNLLGVSTRARLRHARLNNVFVTDYLHHPWGKPRPLFACRKPLDPSARLFAHPDPIWSITNAHERIPPNIEATLTRVPVHVPSAGRRAYRDTTDVHPEHPDLDKAPRRNCSRALPPPPPDYVWYKWKGDQYMGYDWRRAEKNPQIRIDYEKRQAHLAHLREHRKQKRREHPRPSKAQGSMQFRGWRWLCPTCGRVVNILYYPLPRLHLLPLPSRERAGERVKARDRRKALIRQNVLDVNGILTQADAQSRAARPPQQHFACKHCHKVRYAAGCKKSAWGEIVAYLSGGLLYGNEVKRPAWFQPKRRLKYAPRPNHPPSQRRPQIERLLLAGHTMASAAKELGLAKGTVLFYTKSIYQQHNVRGLKELLLKHNVPLRPHIRGPALGKRGQGGVARQKRARERAGAPGLTPAVKCS